MDTLSDSGRANMVGCISYSPWVSGWASSSTTSYRSKGFAFQASRSSTIYRARSNEDYSLTSSVNYNDVTTKAISIARYLKCF